MRSKIAMIYPLSMIRNWLQNNAKPHQFKEGEPLQQVNSD